MKMSRKSRPAVIAVAVIVIAGGCGANSTDRAGGSGVVDPVVITMAQPNDQPPEPLQSWADELATRSNGSMRIEFANGWRAGESDYETGTIKDVQAGKVDMSWVGARAFDRLGLTSFQPLLAPLLVDSHDLQKAVFDAGIPAEMLATVESLDLAGIGVLPGPMRKVMGVDKPYATPKDFAGSIVGIGPSALASDTMTTLRATPQDLPTGATLHGLDAMDQQMASIAGNRYWTGAKYVMANLNLWPRPLVIVMNNERFADLSEEHRLLLTDSAAATVDDALGASRQEDDEAAATLCAQGMTLSLVANDGMAAFRTALDPVYATIASDPANAEWLDRIVAIKSELGAPPDAGACPTAASNEGAEASESAERDATAFPEGRFQAVITEEDVVAAGLQGADVGSFTIEIDDGTFEVIQPNGESGFFGTYTAFRDRIEIVAGEDNVAARWATDGDQLVFTEIEPADSPFELVLGSHPWTPIIDDPAPEPGTFPEGVFETMLLPDDGEGCSDGDWYERRLELHIADGIIEQLETRTTPGAATETGFYASYIVLRDRVEFIEPSLPERLTFKWTFDGQQLTFSDLADDYGNCGHAVIWESHPFTLVQ
jgi:TRAP-type C4-dicarboxylate transport system substrate-binding protein